MEDEGLEMMENECLGDAALVTGPRRLEATVREVAIQWRGGGTLTGAAKAWGNTEEENGRRVSANKMDGLTQSTSD